MEEELTSNKTQIFWVAREYSNFVVQSLNKYLWFAEKPHQSKEYNIWGSGMGSLERNTSDFFRNLFGLNFLLRPGELGKITRTNNSDGSITIKMEKIRIEKD